MAADSQPTLICTFRGIAQALILVLGAPFCLGAPVTVATSSPQIPAPGVHALTRADAEAWLDGLVPAALKGGLIPGAVVAIVKDGEVLLEKGYGYADYDTRSPVDPRATLFRVGSVSKLFTWTAVMQQVEEGRIDLDRDINAYLDFRIPPRNGQHITMRQLMKHLGGFEETSKNAGSYGNDKPNLAEYVRRQIPKRIFDAGTTPAYSNYAATLAGYMVARVSGQDFEAYTEQRIFEPLGMTHSTFRQPLPAELSPYVSRGYQTSDIPPRGFENIVEFPAGGLSATADDMARFMIAHLQNGQLGSHRILKEPNAVLMHTGVTHSYPGINGIALGFYEQNLNGRRIVGHSGDTPTFHSNLSLFIDDGIGLFVSINAEGRGGEAGRLRRNFLEGFVDRYMPAPPPVVTVDAATAKVHAALVAGSYIASRRAESSFLSILSLMRAQRVRANPDGSIDFGGPGKWIETTPYVWSQLNEHDRLAAVVRDGRVVMMGTDRVGFARALLPATTWQSLNWQMPLFQAAIGVLAVTVVLWPALALLRLGYKSTRPSSRVRPRSILLVRLAACVSIGAVLLWAWLFDYLSEIVKSPDGLIHLAEASSALGFVGGLSVSFWHLIRIPRTMSHWRAVLVATLWVTAFAIMAVLGVVHHLIAWNASF